MIDNELAKKKQYFTMMNNNKTFTLKSRVIFNRPFLDLDLIRITIKTYITEKIYLK